MNPYDYRRRATTEVVIGGVPLGGDNPVRIQSMTNTSTMDTDASVAQTEAIASAGADYVRLTAQGVREAANLGEIRRRLRQKGVSVPLIADIHFNPRAAFAAAETVEKVRINPGNFVDPGRTFKKLTYTDSEYQAELQRIDDALTPFIELCRKNSVAIRIGVNHGSLSDRIMSRYGDTPAGMAESAMEFLRVCVRRGFKNVVISMKASNTVVMVESVRRLVAAMDAEQMHFPLHLGVTEAGEGEDGRVKSAVGIATLLAQGLGDTVRVSLSEAPEAEIPVARELVDYIGRRRDMPPLADTATDNPYRIENDAVRHPVAEGLPRTAVVMAADDAGATFDADRTPDLFVGDETETADVGDGSALPDTSGTKPVVLWSSHPNAVGALMTAMRRMEALGSARPVIARLRFDETDPDTVTLHASADFGTLLLNGLCDAVMLDAPALTAGRRANLSFAILQAARRRFTRTEFISCPGCGRTLFDLQSTLAEIKAATSHLKGLKIGVMGCIVNGPGEMADADYGYVGAAAGHVSLYRGKECVEKNIDASMALPRLIEILKNDGVWTDR